MKAETITELEQQLAIITLELGRTDPSYEPYNNDRAELHAQRGYSISAV